MSWTAITLSHRAAMRHSSPQHISVAKSLRSDAKSGIDHDLIDAAGHHDLHQATFSITESSIKAYIPITSYN